MNKIEYDKKILFHPGYYVKDLIDEQDITHEELEERLETTLEYVNNLVDGDVSLNDEVALKLSDVFVHQQNYGLI